MEKNLILVYPDFPTDELRAYLYRPESNVFPITEIHHYDASLRNRLLQAFRGSTTEAIFSSFKALVHHADRLSKHTEALRKLQAETSESEDPSLAQLLDLATAVYSAEVLSSKELPVGIPSADLASSSQGNHVVFDHQGTPELLSNVLGGMQQARTDLQEKLVAASTSVETLNVFYQSQVAQQLVPATTEPVAYTKVRFEFTATRMRGMIQLRHIRFKHCPVPFEPAIFLERSAIESVINPTGSSPSGEEPYRVLEDDYSKWLNYDYDEKSVLEISFKKPVCLNSYIFCTANDCPERDPRDWRLYGINNTVETLLDSRSMEELPYDRYTDSRTFELSLIQSSQSSVPEDITTKLQAGFYQVKSGLNAWQQILSDQIAALEKSLTLAQKLQEFVTHFPQDVLSRTAQLRQSCAQKHEELTPLIRALKVPLEALGSRLKRILLEQAQRLDAAIHPLSPPLEGNADLRQLFQSSLEAFTAKKSTLDDQLKQVTAILENGLEWYQSNHNSSFEIVSAVYKNASGSQDATEIVKSLVKTPSHSITPAAVGFLLAEKTTLCPAGHTMVANNSVEENSKLTWNCGSCSFIFPRIVTRLSCACPIDKCFSCQEKADAGVSSHMLTVQYRHSPNSPIITKEASAEDPISFLFIEIVSAAYGSDESHWIDVTDTVKEIVQSRYSWIAGSHNDLFGDPCPGIRKFLKVSYLLDLKGSLLSQTVDENSSMIFTPFEVISARYGADDHWIEVTAQLKTRISHIDDKYSGSYNDLFGDPLPGVRKSLKVTYRLDANESEVRYDENDTIGLSPVVVQALYGAPGPNGDDSGVWRDVSERYATLSSNFSESVAASNNNFGDPVPGVVKMLRVVLLYHPASPFVLKTVSENQVMHTNRPPMGKLPARIIRVTESESKSYHSYDDSGSASDDY